MTTKLPRKILFLIVLGSLVPALCGCKTAARATKQPTELTMDEIAKKANAGDKSAQRDIARRYATGNKLVKDEVLSEQWALRADENLRATSGGNALAALREKRAEEAGKNAGSESVSRQKYAPKKKSESGVPAQKRQVSQRDNGVKKQSKPSRATASGTQGAGETSTVQVDDFQRILRAASQGNKLALQRFQTDAEMKAQLADYAKTPEGKKNPFVQETLRRLKK